MAERWSGCGGVGVRRGRTVTVGNGRCLADRTVDVLVRSPQEHVKKGYPKGENPRLSMAFDSL